MRMHNKHHPHLDEALPLSVRHLSFGYQPGALVLDRVSLSIADRSLSCVIGPNGGGKTTLLRLVLGLLEPQAGCIEVFGAPPHRACSWIGYVPQHITLQPDFPITVREVVGMGCAGRHRAGTHRSTCRAEIDQAMDRAGVAGIASHSFARLSGGQRQRVLIARALASSPRLLLLDEPTAGVDPAFNRQFHSLLAQLKQTLAVVVVSHDLTFTGPGADQVVFVDRNIRSFPSGTLDSELLWRLYRREEAPE